MCTSIKRKRVQIITKSTDDPKMISVFLQLFSMYGLRTSSLSMIWGLIRNANSQAPFENYKIRESRVGSSSV